MPVNERGYAVPTLATDAVLLNGDRVLLVRRGREPHAGAWALPGGFVEPGERTEEAVLRELAEETGVQAKIQALVGVYSDPERDPRGHVISVTYLCTPVSPAACEAPQAGDDADEARWWPLDEVPELAFDHARILADARRALAAADRGCQGSGTGTLL